MHFFKMWLEGRAHQAKENKHHETLTRQEREQAAYKRKEKH